MDSLALYTHCIYLYYLFSFLPISPSTETILFTAQAFSLCPPLHFMYKKHSSPMRDRVNGYGDLFFFSSVFIA